MNQIDIVVGKNLRALRVQAGLSQETLGEAVGISFQQIQKYERGANRIAASRMVELTRVLKCQIADLFAGIDSGELQADMRDLSEIRQEQKLLSDYRLLPPFMRHALREYASLGPKFANKMEAR